MARDIREVFDAMVPEAAEKESPPSTPSPESPPAPLDSPSPPPERERPPETATDSEGWWIGIPLTANTDIGVAIAWNLANRLEQLGYPCALLPDPPPHGSRAARRSQTSDDTDRGRVPLLLQCLPGAETTSAAKASRSPHAWLLPLGPDDEDRERKRELALEIAYWRPGAPVGVITFSSSGQEPNAERTFETFAAEVLHAGGPNLTHVGALVNLEQLVQAWSNRRPLDLLSEKPKAWSYLVSVTEQLLAFLETPDAQTRGSWLEDAVRSFDPSLHAVAHGIRAESTKIDLIATDSEGRLTLAFDARRDDLSCFTRALGSLSWVESQLTASSFWLQLGPAVGIAPRSQPRVLLLAPESPDGAPRFHPETRAAASRLPAGTLELIEAPAIARKAQE